MNDDLDFGQTIRGLVGGQFVFGRFRLERMLGRGGMGVVWLARDERLEEEVALKFLPETVRMDSSAVDELKRETRKSRQLTHAGIVRIHDFVEDATGAAIAMEYISGQTLAHKRLEKPCRAFEPEDIRDWMIEVCEALDYAHREAKIVHRDLKPANIMVAGSGRIKITDFGIARSISDSMSRASIQRPGTSGSPPYMSPQQAIGEPSTPQDDIYGLGATIYDLLTGKPPFYSGDIFRQIETRTPPSMGDRRREFDLSMRPVPPEWESLVADCLAKDPAARPLSAAAVAKMLAGGSSTTAVPSALPIKTRASPVPKPTILVGFAIASITGLLILVLLAVVLLIFRTNVGAPSGSSSGSGIANVVSGQKEQVASAVPAQDTTVVSVHPAAKTGGSAMPSQQPDSALVQKISRLVADSDRSYRVGNFDTALKGINEAADLLPDDPGILLRRARLLESMQQPTEAAADYSRVAALPGLSAELHAMAERKLTQLGGHVSKSGTDKRDEIALLPGSILGIVDANLRDGSPGTKVLRIAIKARPGTSIDSRQMKLHVFFYEKEEAGDIQLTESKVVSQWMSPPVDWKKDEPELLDVTYILPDSHLPGSAASNGSPGRTFAGYIVGIYYNNELQDTLADPGNLAKKFPLPLYLKQESQ